MVDRGKTMLRFITSECPDDRGDILTLFRHKYPELGLRAITQNVAKKMGRITYMHAHAHAPLPPPPPPPPNHTYTLTNTQPGIQDVDTFTRWRKHYMLTGCFRPDRRGRFTSGFLLRHDDLKDKLRQWILGQMKKDINILDVCIVIKHT